MFGCYRRELFTAPGLCPARSAGEPPPDLVPAAVRRLIDVSIPLLPQWERGQVHPVMRYWQQIVLAETGGIQALQQGRVVNHNIVIYNIPFFIRRFIDGVALH